MFNLTLSEEQLKLLHMLLDTHLKVNGLNALNNVVSLYNVLQSATKVVEQQ